MLVQASRDRLRPILMTTVAMVFGMLPIAVSAAAGAEWKSGLAWALIGGLISSLLLTLVLVPVVYVKFDQMRETVPAFFARLLKRFARNGREASAVEGGAGMGMPEVEAEA